MDKVLSKVRRAGLVLALALVMTVAALATNEGSGETTATAGVDAITNQVVSGLSGMVPTILTAIGAVAVAGLAIFGAKFALNQGLKMFQTITHKQ